MVTTRSQSKRSGSPAGARRKRRRTAWDSPSDLPPRSSESDSDSSDLSADPLADSASDTSTSGSERSDGSDGSDGSETDTSVSDAPSDDESDLDWVVDDGPVSIEEAGSREIVLNYKGLQRVLVRTGHADLAGKLLEVVQVIDERTPNFLKILSENIDLEHRVQLVELYEALKEMESACQQGQPCRMEYLNLRNQIHVLTKKYRRKKALRDRLTEEARQRGDDARRTLAAAAGEAHDTMEERILELQASSPIKAAIYDRYKRMESLAPGDDERAKIRTWLEWAVSMPYDRLAPPPPGDDVAQILLRLASELHRELHGLEAAKEQILTFVATRLRAGASSRGDILALRGPPGTGKTSIARLLTRVLGVPFAQISFGGVTNPEFFTGHDYTYVGSRPGEIARAMKSLGCKNGIVFMDEFEKVSENKATVAALLHIVDKQQNSEFRDHYLRDVTLDLSKLWFICSMNDSPADSALRDRLFTVSIPGYDAAAKRAILVKHLLPKALSEFGLDPSDVALSEEAVALLVSTVSPGISGARPVEVAIRDLVRKAAFLESVGDTVDRYPFAISFKLASAVTFPFSVDEHHVHQLLGKRDHSDAPPPGMYT